MQSNYINIENRLAEAMLKHAAVDFRIKNTLCTITNSLFINVLKPIKEAVCNITSVDELPYSLRVSLMSLAKRHSAQEKQYGAILANQYLTSTEILNSISNIKHLLNEIEKMLLGVTEVDTVDDIVKIIKLIIDLGDCYSEYFTDEFRCPEFKKIYSMINPTREEYDARIRRTELGEIPQLAISFGIGTKPDLDFTSVARCQSGGRIAGKAIFAGLSMEKRLELIIKQYDDASNQHDECIHKIDYIEYQLELPITAYKEKLIEDLKQLNIEMTIIDEKHYSPALKKMQFYGIPLLQSARQPLIYYAKRYQTAIEKYVKADPLQMNAHLPLIASVSGSTARALITLQDTGAFLNTNGKFDFSRAQILSNCLMGFFILAGHHSYIEVAEVYNRLLDYLAIEHPEQLPEKIRPRKPLYQFYAESAEILEMKLPYYVIGDYRSFLHSSYAEDILKKAELDQEIPRLKPCFN